MISHKQFNEQLTEAFTNYLVRDKLLHPKSMPCMIQGVIGIQTEKSRAIIPFHAPVNSNKALEELKASIWKDIRQYNPTHVNGIAFVKDYLDYPITEEKPKIIVLPKKD